MNCVRVLGYLIVSFSTLSTFGNCEMLNDCKTMVVNDAELRNDLFQRSLHFYQKYDLNLEFEDYYIDLFSHMCDENGSVCDIKLYFRNSAKPFSRGTFEEKYRIDELGKHVTINGVWNPYSSTDPYNFEKVDDGFDFYKNTTVWFHTPIANLSDEFNITTLMTMEERDHLLRLQMLRKSTLQMLESLEGEDKFVEYHFWPFGLHTHSIRFQKYPEIKLQFTKTLKKMSFDQRAPQEPVKFVCVNGDFNTYNIAVNVGRYVRGGFSRNTSSSTSLRAIITGKNVSSSLIEEDCGRDSESECDAMVVNDAELRNNLFQRSLSSYRKFDGSTVGSEFSDSFRFQDYPDVQVFFAKKIEKMSVNPDNPTVTFKCSDGYLRTYKIALTVDRRLFHGYFRTS